ncbi:MAG: hypothetical protein ABIV42_07360 [Nitrosospira sp.]
MNGFARYNHPVYVDFRGGMRLRRVSRAVHTRKELALLEIDNETAVFVEPPQPMRYAATSLEGLKHHG